MVLKQGEGKMIHLQLGEFARREAHERDDSSSLGTRGSSVDEAWLTVIVGVVASAVWVG